MGSHYGKKIRDLESAVLKNSRGKHECPKCGKPKKVKRISTGIWKCASCNAQFAGGAYSPQTEAGVASRRALKSAQTVSQAQ